MCPVHRNGSRIVTGITECIYILTERDEIMVHWLLCMADDHYNVSRFSGHFFFSKFQYGWFARVYKSCQLDR